MASLSGNKIKDTFNLLLKLQSSEASATEQVVEDGAGNDTALKISTDTVETTGSLKISGTPSTSTSNTTALMLDGSGIVVTRNLSTSPIGTTSITANTPLSATGSTIELKDPVLLSQITQPATNDKYLIWDESTSAYKYIEQSDLATAVGNSISAATQEQSIMFARQGATQQLSSTNTVAVGSFAEIYEDSSATGATTATGSSVYFGTKTNLGGDPALSLAQVSDPNDSILINEVEGWYRITATLNLIQTVACDFSLVISTASPLTLRSINLPAEPGLISTHTLNAIYYSDGQQGYKIQLKGVASGLGVNVYARETSMQVEWLGDNTSL